MKQILSSMLLLVFISSLFTPVLGGEPTSIEITPLAAVNPVKTQHTFVATVLDEDGNPLPNQRVEWILARGPKAVGDIVEHDDKDAIVGANNISKLSNHYSVSYTNEGSLTITKGTDKTSDDIELGVGQTWCTITSPLEGETHVIAFCSAIKNHDKHKVFAIKYWIDAKISWPENAVNRVGEPHEFKFNITKASEPTPLTGYRVEWTLLDGGPEGSIGSGNKKVTETLTNEEGDASITLKQIDESPGINTIELKLKSPEGKLLATRRVTKTWVSPEMQIAKSGPADGIIGENVTYNVTVTNSGQSEAREVVVKDTLPKGLIFKSSSEDPKSVQGRVVTWELGVLKQGESKSFSVVTKAVKVGTWKNVAQVFSDRGEGPKADAETKIGSPKLYIIKEGPAQIRLGNIGTYTLTIKNKGNAPAKKVSVRDKVPQGLSYKNKSTGFALVWDLGTLAPGEEKKIVYRLQTVRVGTFVNQAFALLDKKAVHKAKFTTKVVAPALSVKKEASQRFIFLFKPVDFKIVVENKGTGVAFDVNVLDNLPKELDYVSSTPPGIYKAPANGELASVRWRLGDIPAGEKKTITLKLRGKLVGRCQNTVKVTSEGKVYEDSAKLTIKGVSAMHLSSYDTEDPVEVGKQTIYVIDTRNEGTSPCTNVTLVNEIPEEMEFVSATGPTEFKFDEEKRAVVFEPYPILQPAAKLVYKIVCRAIKQGDAKNHTILTYDQFEKPIIDEEGTSIYK